MDRTSCVITGVGESDPACKDVKDTVTTGGKVKEIDSVGEPSNSVAEIWNEDRASEAVSPLDSTLNDRFSVESESVSPLDFISNDGFSVDSDSNISADDVGSISMNELSSVARFDVGS